jgi:predicted AAA+ superfamily ATPase
MQREEDLSTHEVKKMGSLDLSTTPAGRSSHMKYLSMTFTEILVKQLQSTGPKIWNSKPFEI